MKKSILLIDDDEMIILLLSNTLKKHGYKVYTATNGKFGIEKLKKHSNINLVITDYDMSEITGIEVLKFVKANYSLPVIMLTSFNDIPLIIKSMQLGACDYIEKPIYSEELLKCVENTLTDFNCTGGEIINSEQIEKNTLTENFLISGNEGTAKRLISKLNYHKDIELLPVCDIMKKSIMDFILSFFIILFSSPVLLTIALLIKITSKGPVIFKQSRIGLHGKEFTLYKFRTMSANAEEMKKDLMTMNEADGPVFKIKKDPRVTKIGGFLRKTGIDEFPQFFNVLKGDMSIIGPRPSLEQEIKKYKKKYFLRLLAKPGISCLWQIQKNRNKIKFDEWMQLDMDYINNWSMYQDIKIFFKTFSTMIYGRGQ
jgi:lipopolysaccharide/colanic/teichoic acid biosynthesis glycosyltransferase/ActR/RegA family two-component response regulator